jgi:hypothetical protein
MLSLRDNYWKCLCVIDIHLHATVANEVIFFFNDRVASVTDLLNLFLNETLSNVLNHVSLLQEILGSEVLVIIARLSWLDDGY